MKVLPGCPIRNRSLSSKGKLRVPEDPTTPLLAPLNMKELMYEPSFLGDIVKPIIVHVATVTVLEKAFEEGVAIIWT